MSEGENQNQAPQEETSQNQLVEQKSDSEFLLKDGLVMNIDNKEYLDYMDNLYKKLGGNKHKITASTDRSLGVRHPWHGVPIGRNSPDILTAVIEIPSNSRVKTELDKTTGLLRVDKILHSSVVYPANYGFIPETLAEDEDPLDILVLCQLTVPPLSLMQVRPIGIMPMVDEDKPDDKIIAVAINDPEYNIYYDVSELPPYKLIMINQFFNDYQTLERKEVRTFKPLSAGKAKRIIDQCHQRYHDHFQT